MTFAAIARDVPLAPLTTLRLGGAARYFADVVSEGELVSALEWASERGIAVAVLGFGSNVIVPDEGFDGLVVRVSLRGREVAQTPEGALLRVAAGEDWDGCVRFAVEQGLCGLECLSGIPGLVGAAPVQNIGAYGQEVSQCLGEVRTVDALTCEARMVKASELGFAYRDSVLKHPECRLIVTEATFRLARTPRASTHRELLGVPLEVEAIRTAVLALRAKKAMVYGLSSLPNVGSYFTNPVVSPEVAQRLTRSAPMPQWPTADAQVKLAAGWLIEHAGFARGIRRGHFGLSPAHALAIVHYGGGSTEELFAFETELVRGVEAAFGVRLIREPILLARRNAP